MGNARNSINKKTKKKVVQKSGRRYNSVKVYLKNLFNGVELWSNAAELYWKTYSFNIATMFQTMNHINCISSLNLRLYSPINVHNKNANMLLIHTRDFNCHLDSIFEENLWLKPKEMLWPAAVGRSLLIVFIAVQ